MNTPKLMTPLVIGAAIAFIGSAAHADDAATLAAMEKAGCLACHNKDRKLVGPSFTQIAAKRKGEADVVPQLMDKIRTGGKGVYGPIPMAPNPPDKISDGDLKSAVELILKS